MTFGASVRWRGLCAAAAAAGLIAAGALPAAAQEDALLVLGAGATGIADHTVGIASVEYRAGRRLFEQVKPLAGAFATSDGSAYAHAGIYRDWNFTRPWTLTLHVSAGLYKHGDKNDLCNTLEFQSGLDLMYRFRNGWRAGTSLRHLSNAGTGGCNPGIETLALQLALLLR